MQKILSDIKPAVEVLKNGKNLLYPTDTIWGIGCDATNAQAVESVYRLKQRPDSKSMIILVHSDAMLQQYVEEVPPIAWDIIDLADKPTTIIYPQARNLPENLIAPDGSIAVRMVKSGVIYRLLQQFRKPIVSTSANISGQPSPKTFQDISSDITENIDFILSPELNDSNHAKSSSILKIELNGEIKIIRK